MTLLGRYPQLLQQAEKKLALEPETLEDELRQMARMGTKGDWPKVYEPLAWADSDKKKPYIAFRKGRRHACIFRPNLNTGPGRRGFVPLMSAYGRMTLRIAYKDPATKLALT